MPLCSSGSTIVLPESPAFFVYDEADIATFLRPIVGLVTLSLMGLPSGPVETATLCASEPSLDLPTTADYLALISPPVALATGAYTRFGNQVRYNKWIQLCGCGPSGGTLCPTAVTEFSAPTYAPANNGVYANVGYWPIRAGATKVKYVLTNNGDRNLAYRFPLLPVGPSNNLSSGLNLAAGASVTREYTTTDTGALHTWDAFGLDLAGNVGFVGTVNVQVEQTFNAVCGNVVPPTPPPLAPPTGWPGPTAPFGCGTTTDVCLALSAINDKLRSMALTLDLIQRQEVPFAYVQGTAHAGLTGTGTFAVAGILGLRVDLTTIPPHAGYTAGNPVTYWGVGEVALGTSTGFTRREVLRHDPQLIFSGEAGLYTIVGYTFPPGVVATITELVREA